MELNSWELTDFNIEGHIILSARFGHSKMMRVEDGTLILAADANHGRINQEEDTPSSFFNPDSTLGFILDIGIRKEKQLTYGHGFYFGSKLIQTQSTKKISQADFDKELFEKIGGLIETLFQSGNAEKEIKAVKIQFLIDEYNNARLLYPNFYAESYLSLMRIIDALSNDGNTHTFAGDYAAFIATVSHELNQEIYEKLMALSAYTERLSKAKELFQSKLAEALDKHWACYATMSTLDEAGKIVFACFYSAYQYRNKFVHKGFPFPRVVKDSQGLEDNSGLAYISSSLGMSWTRFHRPITGLQEGDLLDVHEVVGDDAEIFKSTYFILIPTWYFLKRMARQSIINKIETLLPMT